MAADGTALMIFSSRACRICRDAFVQAGEIQELAGAQPVIFLFRDELPQSVPADVQAASVGQEFFDAFGVQSTPFVVQVVDGVVRNASPAGSVALLREFAARAAEDRGGASDSAVGF
jgi:hypothetical protein